MSDLNVNICIPAFGYDAEGRERHACARAIAREIEFAAPELREYRIGRVEVRNACCVSDEDAGHIFAALLRSCDLDVAVRVADVAPEQLNVALLTTLRNFRIDMYRVDLGSLNATDFHNLGRAYDLSVCGFLAKALDAFSVRNWCAVLDLGIKGQKASTLDDGLTRLFELGPAAVELRVGAIEDARVDEACILYERAAARLAQEGLAPLAPRLFARAGYGRAFETGGGEPPECWGFGPGALSYMDGCSMGVVRTTHAYVALMGRDEPPVPGVMRLDDPTRARNYIRRSLESAHGLDVAALSAAYGDGFRAFLDGLVERGLAFWQEGRLVLTTRGIVREAQIMRELEGHQPISAC